jgi:hypothetical protein
MRRITSGLILPSSRLIFIPALFLVADPTQGQLRTLSATSFLAAFAAHAFVAEARIRLTRKGRVPGASGAETAYAPTPDNG